MLGIVSDGREGKGRGGKIIRRRMIIIIVVDCSAGIKAYLGSFGLSASKHVREEGGGRVETRRY